MLCNSTVVRIVGRVVAMKRLSFCAGSDAEDDGIVQLRNTDALFFLVTNLKNFNDTFAAQIGNLPSYACCG
jgi:hypothetical protein